MFYDRANQTTDIDLFVRAREEEHLNGPGDVEVAFGDTEKVRDLLVDLLIQRVRAAAVAVNARVTAREEQVFRACIEESFDDFYTPISDRLGNAWKDRGYTDPNAEHRLSYQTEAA